MSTIALDHCFRLQLRCVDVLLRCRWLFTGCVAGHSLARARAAMPFGCLTLGEKKDYNSPSDVTDKYDLGQIVKSWVHLRWNKYRQLSGDFVRIWPRTWQAFPFSVFFTERSFVRYFGRKTGTPWKCTHVKSSTKKMEGKSGKLPRMRSWS